ncbi:DUF6308 family protein [Micromonospora chalcea]|uniref:DUF6308 family protein n=1 Tax=Micromonospora chalcea TaxID=1874 RepID=UPI003332951A
MRASFEDNGPRLHSGRRLDSLGGGGDRAKYAGPDWRERPRCSADAVGKMVPAEAAIRLLEGELGRRIGELLAVIPTNVELGADNSATLVADGRATDRAWHLLDEQPGIDYVISGNLMVRKRPHLIPAYDQVIACLFGRPDHVWLRLRCRPSAEQGLLRKELARLRIRAALPATVSLLRILDVALWIHHLPHHQRTRSCPGSAPSLGSTVTRLAPQPRWRKPDLTPSRELAGQRCLTACQVILRT